jgi:cold shock CspA family protein
MHGSVARVTPSDGTGVLRSIDGREFFFHRSALREVAFEALAPGTRVSFEVGHEPADEVGEAPRAIRVHPAGEALPAAGSPAT